MMRQAAQDYIGLSNEDLEDITEDVLDELEKMRVLH